MTADVVDAPERVQPQNAKRIKYFAGISNDLRLVSMYTNILSIFGEDEDGEEAYEALERLRVVWRNLEMKRIKANLERMQYRLKGGDYISLVLDNRRLEQVSEARSLGEKNHADDAFYDSTS